LLRADHRGNQPPLQRPRGLDFGCGVGRVLQYFIHKGFELHACDVDDSAIAYIKAAYPGVRATVNRFEPPLPYPDRHFDIIYSVSVWTHLPPDLQEPWLLEIGRILRPGGLALLTTLGPHGYRLRTHLHALKFSLEELLATGLQFSPYPDPNAAPNTRRYGVAYHTHEYIRREWSRFFDVVEIQEGIIDNLQDLVVLCSSRRLKTCY
jgi:SAM-dependent methyltransferase